MSTTEPRIHYDEVSDTVHVTFVPGRPATGIELNENILLRIDKRERVAVGLSLFSYSALRHAAGEGSGGIPLDGLSALPRDLRAEVLTILLSPPVRDFLRTSIPTPPADDGLPTALLLSDRITPWASPSTTR